MSDKKERILNEEKDWNKVDDLVITSESFFIKHGKKLLIALGVVVVIAGLYFAYQYLYINPKNKEAANAIYKGQTYFENQMDSLALYGDNNGYIGFEAIISEYGSTATGNLAKVYAGLSYARLGNNDQALTYLKDYKGKDQVIAPAVKGAIGDCLVNTGKPEEAISYFEDAARTANDNLFSPIFYQKAGLTYRHLKKYDKVIDVFTILKNNYMNTPQGMDAEKYILEAQTLKAK